MNQRTRLLALLLISLILAAAFAAILAEPTLICVDHSNPFGPPCVELELTPLQRLKLYLNL